jgi:membrane-associated phospholipid phosphatase
MKNKIFSLALCLICVSAQAQTKVWYYVAGLTTASAALYTDFARTEQRAFYQNNLSTFQTSADDITQHAPMIIQMGLHLVGGQSKQQAKDQIAMFVIGTGTYSVITQGLKYTINETRPNGEDRSFPSGHTATAFFGARMLDRAYGKKSTAIALTGYALATATGALRIANNKHWVSDVAMGAAIGIASAEVAHWIYPKLQKSLKKTAIAWEPIIGTQYYAARISYVF